MGIMRDWIDGKHVKKNKKRWQSAEMNELQFQFYYNWLEQISCSIWQWENLPPEIDQRFLELALYNCGLSLFFYDDEYGHFFSTWATPSGKINMYMNPIRYIAYGADGFRRDLSIDQCVPIWNNYLRMPDVNAMTLYARRLADIDRTLDVNLAGQKMPVLLCTSEAQRLTVQNLVKQWFGNEPVIVGTTELLQNSDISYVRADVPYIADKLIKDKMSIWSEIMTYIGIDNINIQKDSRVQSAEVNSNAGQIEASRLIKANCRRQACEQINRMYELDVWCDFNHDISSINFNTLLAAPSLQYTDDTDVI